MGLEGQRVLVIGGGSGVGRAIAQGAAAAAASVVIASSNAEKVARAAQALGAAVSSVVLDVTDEAAVAEFFASAGTFDHIAFTAGDWNMPLPGPLSGLNLVEATKMLNVRFWGAVSVAKHGASSMPPGGSFTVTGGMLAHQPVKGRPLWTAAAGAIESLTIGLAADLAPIRVNCVCLGLVQTEQWDAFPPQVREGLLKTAERQLLPRPGQPSEAAEAFLYLMRNAFVTGQIVRVEGGIALAP